MTARSSLAQAAALSAELDQVTQALSLVAAGTFNVRLELTADGFSGLSVNINPGASALTTLLTARLNTLQAALTSLGVT